MILSTDCSESKKWINIKKFFRLSQNVKTNVYMALPIPLELERNWLKIVEKSSPPPHHPHHCVSRGFWCDKLSKHWMATQPMFCKIITPVSQSNPILTYASRCVYSIQEFCSQLYEQVLIQKRVYAFSGWRLCPTLIPLLWVYWISKLTQTQMMSESLTWTLLLVVHWTYCLVQPSLSLLSPTWSAISCFLSRPCLVSCQDTYLCLTACSSKRGKAVTETACSPSLLSSTPAKCQDKVRGMFKVVMVFNMRTVLYWQVSKSWGNRTEEVLPDQSPSYSYSHVI